MALATRRALLAAALALPALAVLGGLVVPAARDPRQRLVRALARARLPYPGELLLLDFAQSDTDGQVTMRAAVRLTWAPGMRQCPFRATGADAETALAALLDEVIGTFSGLRVT